MACAAFLAAPADAKAPERMSLSSQSPDAIVVLKTDWWRPAPNMQSAFKLTLSTYAAEDGKLTGNMLGGAVLVEAKQKNMVEGYLIVPIKAGRWIVQSYSQQDKWALCFNASSLQFEVGPGEVVYLGKFDALAHRRQLTAQAVGSGKTMISGYGFADFFDLSEGPRFEPVDDMQVDAVKEMLGRRAPGVTAPVKAVAFGPASFGTGSTLFAERKCGGYFKAGVKKEGGGG
ncbi:hypothetical protein SCLO_1031770 [Sphingobium cloacae]|uniref:Uncharacterized protein n=2 Tax=Sphingobium cloacae TaxID=120107 RepID=A0A1E1F6V0_9SPHN|nr:hypothetical protein SCLO_1031770 [Sphingobium cloacae]